MWLANSTETLKQEKKNECTRSKRQRWQYCSLLEAQKCSTTARVEAESPLGIKVSMPASVKGLHGTALRPHAARLWQVSPLHSFTTASTAEGNTEIKKTASSKNHLVSSPLLPFIFYLAAAFVTSRPSWHMGGFFFFCSGSECLSSKI